jgi:3-oxoacyl-[acyl-carrier protein] reductase
VRPRQWSWPASGQRVGQLPATSTGTDAEGQTPYAAARGQDAGDVLAAIAALGGKAVAWEADLADPASAGQLFDATEEPLGPVSILVNNASGWRLDTFSGTDVDDLGRSRAK